MLDVLIIGAGPIGLACGIEAKNAELTYAIVEKGCLTNSLYHYPLNMTFFSTSDRLEIGGVPFTSVQPKPNRQEALEYYRRVTDKFALEVHLFEAVTDIVKIDDHFEVTTAKKVWLAKNIVVSTGFFDIPALLGVPGENLPKVTHYYKDPHFYAFQQVLVVGANNSAVDAALETYRKGAKVTMVIKGDSVGERVKYWARPDIVNRIEEGSITAYFNSAIKSISAHSVDIQTPQGLISIPNDFVIAMTGYQPNFDLLHKIGVALSNDGKFYPEYDSATMQTNIKGVYLAGVVVGGMDTHKWFIENSRIHAPMIMQHIAATIKMQ